MYKVEQWPAARQDMAEIVQYIAEALRSPVAANNMIDKFQKAVQSLKHFPHRCPVVELNESFKQQGVNKEHRKLKVNNYLMLYQINEAEKTVTITRVIYNRRNYSA